MTDYEIRQYKDEDRDKFFDLYQDVLGQEKTDSWFAWKYEENPYVDHIPMMVAVSEGELVGARPFFALPVSIDGEHRIAHQPGDTMVHPDHRRQGLFTRMTEQAIERYSDDHPFFFNFPNHRSRPGYLKLGWEIVSERPTFYRIESPVAVAKDRTDKTLIRTASTIATPFARAYYGLQDARVSASANISIRTEKNIPADELANLYQSDIPDNIHVVRDEEFYDWRFDNPDWEYTAYIAENGVDPKAAIIAGNTSDSGQTTTKLTDVLPLRNPPEEALTNLVNSILSDYSETDLFAAPPQGIPESVLSSFGFLPDTVPPMSMTASQTTHVARSLTDDWEYSGRNITNPENWLLTFAEGDTS